MNKLTLITTAVATAIVASSSVWLPMVPPDYAAAAAGIVALLASVYHLYKEPPNAATK